MIAVFHFRSPVGIPAMIMIVQRLALYVFEAHDATLGRITTHPDGDSRQSLQNKL